MRDESRLWRKPQQRLNIVAVRERIAKARERMEMGGVAFEHVAMSDPLTRRALDVCCQALEGALLLHAFDRESALDLVADSLVLLRAERSCRERGE